MSHRIPALLVVAAGACLGGSPAAAQDYKVTHQGPGVSGMSSQGMAYDVGDMIDEVESVYGSGLADEMRDELTGPDADICVTELSTPGYADGASDDDTILVNTKNHDGSTRISLFVAAMILAHEYEHATRPRPTDPDTGEPEPGDPMTGGPCGECYHAQMHIQQMCDLMALLDGDCQNYTGPPSKDDICAAFELNKTPARGYMDKCLDDPLCCEITGGAGWNLKLHDVCQDMEGCCP